MALFDEMANESITITKSDGTRNGPYKASFSKNIMRVFGQEIDADDGDSVERPLPNGKIEYYTIEESTFIRGKSVMPDNWKLIVRKDTSLRPRGGAQTTNHINIHDSHGIQIGNHNVQHVKSVIDSLIASIESSDGTPEEKTEAKSRLQKFLSHPIVASTLGATAGAIIKSMAT